MTLTFPDNPVLNQEYQAENGLTYYWDGEKWSSQGSYNIDQDNYIRKDGSNTVVYADNLGMGIGTTTPTSNLDIVSTGSSSKITLTRTDATTVGSLALSSGTSSNFIDSLGTSKNLNIRNNNINVASFTSDGKVGIGTVAPQTILDISAPSLANDTSLDVINLQDGGIASAGITLDRYQNAQNYGLSFYTSAGSASEKLRIDNNGKVGVGISAPTTRLDVRSGSNNASPDAKISWGRPDGGVLGTLGTGLPDGNNGVSIDSPTDHGIHFLKGGVIKASVTDNGVTFNGDTAAENALDDYEEGTWTPSLRTANNDENFTFSAQTGTYVKIGKLVIVQATLTVSANNGGTGSTFMTGLPFSAAGSNFRTSQSINYRTGFTGIAPSSSLISGSEVTLYRDIVSGTNLGAVGGYQATEWTSGASIRFGLTYQVA